MSQFISPWCRIYATVNRPVLVQIMACRLFGAKPLSKPSLQWSFNQSIKARKSPVYNSSSRWTYMGSVWSCREHRQSCIGISPPQESAWSHGSNHLSRCVIDTHTWVHLTPDFYITELFCANALSACGGYDSHPPNIRKDLICGSP